jgi:L-iditol 2-dehydrogenase
LWKEGSAVNNPNKDPYIMGHECAGEIIALGAKVTKWKIGDRIAIKPGLPCFK